jgi:hypothetical protein
MTLRPEDFTITWKTDLPEQEKPVTYAEVIQAMGLINEKASTAKSSDVIEITLRKPVAETVAAGINKLNPGTAVVDVCRDPSFVPERGGYQSCLSIAQTRNQMIAYINDF